MSVHEELFARAQRVLAGGVSSPVRAFRAVGGTPRYMQRGEGAYLFAEAAPGEAPERWVDFCMAWGR